MGWKSYFLVAASSFHLFSKNNGTLECSYQISALHRLWKKILFNIVADAVELVGLIWVCIWWLLDAMVAWCAGFSSGYQEARDGSIDLDYDWASLVRSCRSGQIVSKGEFDVTSLEIVVDRDILRCKARSMVSK